MELRVSHLEKLTKLSNSTIRRYIDRYLEFLPHEKKGKEKFFAPEAANILLHINKLIEDRTPLDEIQSILQKDYERVIDVEMENNHQQVTKQENALSTDVLAQVMQAVAQQGAMLQQMVTSLDQRQEIAELRAKIEGLEHDRELMEKVRKALEKKPWWKVW